MFEKRKKNQGRPKLHYIIFWRQRVEIQGVIIWCFSDYKGG